MGSKTTPLVLLNQLLLYRNKIVWKQGQKVKLNIVIIREMNISRHNLLISGKTTISEKWAGTETISILYKQGTLSVITGRSGAGTDSQFTYTGYNVIFKQS